MSWFDKFRLPIRHTQRQKPLPSSANLTNSRAWSLKPIGKTTIEFKLAGATETLECIEAIELACKLAAAHAGLKTSGHRSITFEYGAIKAELNGKEIFELSLTLQIVAIPLGNDALDGGWGSKAGRRLLKSLESGAPNMALAESIRASREALNDLSAMTGKEHLAADELYKQFKQVVDSFKTKKSTNAELNGALFSACQNGQLEAVRDLLAKGADVDAEGAFGISCLIKAISLGHLEVAKELLAQGADADATNKNGETAIIHASQAGQVELVNALLASGADVNATGNIGGTALMQASYYGHVGVVKVLLAASANVDSKNIDGTSALFMAAAASRLEVVKALLAHGADANTRMNDGYSALIRASQDGNLEIVQELLSHGAEVNATNNEGYTPLMLCCFKGHLDVARELIVRGANVNAKNNDCDTALKLARADEVKVLLANSGATAQ